MTAISDAGLNVNDSANITGVVRFGSLTKQSNPSSNPAFGRDAYYITIADPKVTSSNNESGFEKYLALREFTSHATGTGPDGEKRITFQNASPIPPKVFDKKDRLSSGYDAPKILKDELAQGQEITLHVHVFPSKLNPGMSLDAILVDDITNIKYVSSGLSIDVFGVEGNPDAPDRLSDSEKTEAEATPAETEATAEEPKAEPKEPAADDDSNQTVTTNPFGGKGTDSEKNFDDPFHPNK